jgi:hypothetical protein
MVRLQERLNERRFLAALDDWEQALARYRQHLHRIGPKLPVGLRRLLDTVALHDARVLAIAQGQRGRFTITLHPETDPSRLVVLDYSLLEPPQKTVSLPPDVWSEPVAWLCDEVDVARPARHAGKIPTAPTFLHNILLTNGWEFRLHFASVTISRPAAVLPAGHSATGGQEKPHFQSSPRTIP